MFCDIFQDRVGYPTRELAEAAYEAQKLEQLREKDDDLRNAKKPKISDASRSVDDQGGPTTPKLSASLLNLIDDQGGSRTSADGDTVPIEDNVHIAAKAVNDRKAQLDHTQLCETIIKASKPHQAPSTSRQKTRNKYRTITPPNRST